MAKYKRINLYDRIDIQAYIKQELSITEIAMKTGFNKSTISRELNRIKVKNYPCKFLKRHPTCNTCKKKGFCNLKKLYYDFKIANNRSVENKVKSRSKTYLSEKDINVIDEIIKSSIGENRQSIHHMYLSNPVLWDICNERTIRRLVYRGELSIKAHQLRRYVRFSHPIEHKKSKCLYIEDLTVLIGRHFDNFLKYRKDNINYQVVEYDSVIGKRNDKQALLTITLVGTDFQFGLLYEKSNPNDTLLKLKNLFNRLGDKAKEIFKINLCDHGIEFSYFYKIETLVGKTFYANPYTSNNKPHCERMHELIRYCLPKGKSLNLLTQEQVNEMFSNINSYVRKSKGDKTPYDIVKEKFGIQFLELIGIKRIPNNGVKLTRII